jgi:hypothetical protein
MRPRAPRDLGVQLIMFVIGKDYSREDIHATCGGNKQAFLPTHHGKVVAACLKPDRNPRGPEVVLCSTRAASRAAGRTFARQGGAVPVFMREDSNRWRYVGRYEVAESLTTPADCAPYISGSGLTLNQVSRVIRLRKTGD